jgi:hypothetical protein
MLRIQALSSVESHDLLEDMQTHGITSHKTLSNSIPLFV